MGAGKVVEFQEPRATEEAYGMNLENLAVLIKSRGHAEPSDPLDPKDPAFEAKFRRFSEYQKSFERARVKLFDRVLSGVATEDEMKIAIDHATEQAKAFGLNGFHSAVPKAWYTDARIAEAIAATSPQNKEWVEYVRKNYSNERLRKQQVIIEKDGSVHTYEPKEGI